MAVHRLTRAQARRIAVRAQLLDARRPTGLVPMVRQLTLLQLDPTAAIAPSADLVAWSRLGREYRPEDLKRALEVDRTLFELDAYVRSAEDLGLQLAGAAGWPPWERTRRWLGVNKPFRQDILELLERCGPMMSRDIPDTSVEPWASTGWTNNRNVTKMLECLMMRGEVAISARSGRQRLWDLAERVYPAALVIPSVDDADRIKNQRRLAALGIARGWGTAVPGEAVQVGETGEPAEVDGVKGRWWVHREQLDALDQEFTARTVLLSPFDRLVYDRTRTLELFGFDYTLEMYKPKEKRRWGYFALPILHHDQLVGKLDATADRKASVLRVHAVHADVRITAPMRRAIDSEIGSLADWIGLQTVINESGD